MEFRVVIIDDEQSSRDIARRMLVSAYPDVIISGEAGSVAEGVSLLSRETPDILMLDVAMEDGTGFDLLDQVKNRSFHVVFITAHDDFAVRAFRYNAIDYLLKPLVQEELIQAIDKASGHLDQAIRRQQIDQLLETTSGNVFDKITLNTNNGLIFTRTDHILRIETYGNYTFVFLSNNERYLVSRNLKEFEEMLPEPSFFRIHQSHIVNTAMVKKYVKEEGGHAVMADGAKLPIARRRKEEFLKALKAQLNSGD